MRRQERAKNVSVSQSAILGLVISRTALSLETHGETRASS